MLPNGDIGTRVGQLDMANGQDRKRLRGAVNRRWKIADDRRDQFVEALGTAMEWALQKGDQRAVNGCVRTLAILESQNQADEHLMHKTTPAGAEKHEFVVRYVDVPPKTAFDE